MAAVVKVQVVLVQCAVLEINYKVNSVTMRGLRLEGGKQNQSVDVGEVTVCCMQTAGSHSCFYIRVTVRHRGSEQEVVS